MTNKEGLKREKQTNKNKDKQVIFRPWITVKGRRIYARSYGKKAFKIYID